MFLLLQQPQELFGFTTVRNNNATPHNHMNKISAGPDGSNRNGSRLYVYEAEIACSTITFASSHIAMSAIRNELIDRIGSAVDHMNWVGTGVKLPDIWPGDEAGQEIFPTKDIAGRQLYRILYTFVSFSTLGVGFAYYLNSLEQDQLQMVPRHDDVLIYYVIASLASGISIASLINPSPLSLVPVYEQSSGQDKNNNASKIRRNDSKKLQVYGLTRITRHPLILPVVPWGIATAMIMGGHTRDFLLFGVLSIYAIAGCAAQDLRVSREEGSVGTVFNPDSSSLQEFFQQTSFVPFQAVLESRQSIDDIVKEFPWWALLAGTAIGYLIQQVFISYLVGHVSLAS